MANNSKYLDYAGLQRLVENINKKYAPIQAIVFKSTVEDIASLPALNTVKAGFMYNIKTGGITTDDFVEGAGHIVADGENIAAVELMTGEYDPQTLAADADPKALGLYEQLTPEVINYNDVTSTLQPTDDPQEMGLYVENPVGSGTYVLTTDTAPQTGIVYYEKVVTPATYQLTQDRLPITGKTYYKAGTVMKWDLMGGVFDLEDRYLEFGDKFPQGPRLVDGRTFLYMGADSKVYTKVASPSGRPKEEGYFELDSATAVTDHSTIYNPKQQNLYEAVDAYVVATPVSDPAAENLYEEDATDPSGYKPTSDTTIDPAKTYYAKINAYVLSADTEDDNTKTYYVCAFAVSTDTTVDTGKVYYTESIHYQKAIIYQYDATAKEWVAQSSSGSGDLIPITIPEIDDLFI